MVSGALEKNSVVGKKRKYTTTFTAEDCAQIGKYAAENGNSTVVKKYKGTHHIGESTVRLFKKKYLAEVNLQRKEKANTEVNVTRIPASKRGRKVLLGEELDEKVKTYILALRKAGTLVGSSVVMAGSEGIVWAYDRTLLVQYGGHIEITRDWA